MTTTQHTIHSTAQAQITEQDRAQRLAERLDSQFLGATELLTVELGRRLGLYAALARLGQTTAAELADATGIARRYAVEWLDQQAAAGYVDVAGSDVPTRQPRFVLPSGHAAALLDPESPAYLMGTAPMLLGLAATLPTVADAYLAGRGVGYADFGDELRLGIADLNRPAYANDVRGWVEQLPDIAARLDRGGIILDAGCGEGWSSIGLATAFPAATVVGIDLDAESVAIARKNAAEAGVADRVTLVEGNAADARTLAEVVRDEVTLVTVFEALHDMGEPVHALVAFRSLLADGGAVLVADHVQDDDKPTPAAETERMQLAVSVLHCLPATWAESERVVNGTVLRAGTLRRWVERAGFGACEPLLVEHPVWRFYRVG